MESPRQSLCEAYGVDTHHTNSCRHVERFKRYRDKTYNMSETKKARIKAYLKTHETRGGNIQELDIRAKHKVVGTVSRSGDTGNIRESVILSSVATQHVFNELDSFVEYQQFNEPLRCLTGIESVPLLGKGVVRVILNSGGGETEEIRVMNAHYQPDYYTNVISSGRWHNMGYVEDNWTDTVQVRDTKEVVCHFTRQPFPTVNAERI